MMVIQLFISVLLQALAFFALCLGREGGGKGGGLRAFGYSAEGVGYTLKYL